MPSKNTQKRYQLIKHGSEFRLELQGEAEIRDPGPHDVVIRVRATSINRRDIMIWRGAYPIGDRVSVVLLDIDRRHKLRTQRGLQIDARLRW